MIWRREGEGKGGRRGRVEEVTKGRERERRGGRKGLPVIRSDEKDSFFFFSLIDSIACL